MFYLTNVWIICLLCAYSLLILHLLFPTQSLLVLRFSSMYSLFFLFHFKLILSVSFCFLVSINSGIPFWTCLLNNYVAGAALIGLCGDILDNNKNLFSNTPIFVFCLSTLINSLKVATEPFNFSSISRIVRCGFI